MPKPQQKSGIFKNYYFLCGEKVGKFLNYFGKTT